MFGNMLSSVTKFNLKVFLHGYFLEISGSHGEIENVCFLQCCTF
jgi:hypothetical protein